MNDNQESILTNLGLEVTLTRLSNDKCKLEFLNNYTVFYERTSNGFVFSTTKLQKKELYVPQYAIRPVIYLDILYLCKKGKFARNLIKEKTRKKGGFADKLDFFSPPTNKEDVIKEIRLIDVFSDYMFRTANNSVNRFQELRTARNTAEFGNVLEGFNYCITFFN